MKLSANAFCLRLAGRDVASSPLRVAYGDGLRPGLTPAARDGLATHGRDRETALDQTEKHRHDRRDGNRGLYF